jgi:glycerol kinase
VSVLVVDAGTSGVRAAVVRDDGRVAGTVYREVLPESPAQGFVQFDAAALGEAALEVAGAALEANGPVAAVGIANQRASTILWDRSNGVPVAPGIGWQDLRTVGMCLMLRSEGIRLAPNQSATKLVALLDMADPDRRRNLCFGTVDSYLAFLLSGGELHVTDHTNAGVTGLVTSDATAWDLELCEKLRVPEGVLPTIVPSSSQIGPAAALAGAPVVAGIAGDQQASLVGQGSLELGEAKATFGTGGMLDAPVGATRPGFEYRGGSGTFPIVAWSDPSGVTYGLEAVMLSAGSCVEWLRDDLGVISSAAESESLAGSVAGAEGVVFVPALLGLGTPEWDFGARGTLLGVSRGTTAAHVVRAVLEGIAARGADLLEAIEADAGITVEVLKVDGGMSANAVFVQALADAVGRPVAVAAVTEATTLGAAFLAGSAAGLWSSLKEATSTAEPRIVVEPTRHPDRARWLEARERAGHWVEELSALDF